MSHRSTYFRKIYSPVLIAAALLLLLTPILTFGSERMVEYVNGEWTPDHGPYFFDDTLVIAPDEELIIKPGVEVILGPYVPIEVRGTLRVVGVYGMPVTIRGALTGEEWAGIQFYPESNEISTIRYANITDCQVGITTDRNSLSEISNNNISARTGGIRCNYASPTIKENRILVSDDRWTSEIYAISLNDNSNPTIINNPLIQCRSTTEGRVYGIKIRESAPKLIEGNWIEVGTPGRFACGIYAQDCDAMLIRRNIIRTQAWDEQRGISASMQREAQLINNTIIFSSSSIIGTGILFIGGGRKDCLVLNNIVIGNGASIGIKSEDQIGPASGWNDFYGHARNYSGNWQGNNDIQADPMFLSTTINDPSAYHLTYPESPCLDTGCPDEVYTDADGSIADMGRWAFDNREVSVREPVLTPVTSEILTTYPNPFNNATTFSFNIIQRSDANLTVYDLTGRVIDKRLLGILDVGSHRVVWNGAGIPSGLYLAVLEHNNTRSVTRIVLLP